MNRGINIQHRYNLIREETINDIRELLIAYGEPLFLSTDGEEDEQKYDLPQFMLYNKFNFTEFRVIFIHLTPDDDLRFGGTANDGSGYQQIVSDDAINTTNLIQVLIEMEKILTQ